MAASAILKCIALAALVLANPNTLQDRYGGPHADHSSRSENSDTSSLLPDDALFSAQSSGPQSAANLGSAAQVGRSGPLGGNSGFAVGSGAQQSSGQGAGFAVGSGAQQSSGQGAGLSFSGAQTGASGSQLSGSVGQASDEFAEDSFFNQEDVTITIENTVDVFETLTNLVYNSVPVTLTEFVKTTLVRPTLQVITTAVDDNVFVTTVPAFRTEFVTVTDTSSSFQCATEVSTDSFTITHLAHDIRQQIVTSTVLQTEIFRPTVVSTRIFTETDTQTVFQTVTNTVIVDANSPNLFAANFQSVRPVSGPITTHTYGPRYGF